MAGTCDIFAHKVVNGKRTNEISTLHVNLLGLGKIAKFFDRRRANRAFHLSNSQKFQNTHSLIYDPNGEVNMVSLYEEARTMFPGVTYDNMLTYMNKPHHPWIKKAGYNEALKEVTRFNKQYGGSRTFMATLEPADDGLYSVKIVFNSEENQQKLIETVSDMNTVRQLVDRLTAIGFGVNQKEGESSLLFKSPKETIQGMQGMIILNSNEDFDTQQKELADNTGILIMRIVPSDNPFVKRLSDIIDKYPSIVKDMLGKEVYQDYSDGRIEKKEVLGRMIGYYLQHYDKIQPKGFISRAFHVIQRFLEWVKMHSPFTNYREYNKFRYEAKYKAYMLAKDFMGENFLADYEITDMGKKEKLLPTEETFSQLRQQLKNFDVLLNSFRDVDSDIYNSYRNEFQRYLDKLNNLATQYQNERHKGIGEELLISDIENESRQTLAQMCKFLVSQIEKGQTLLFHALYEKNPDGSDLSMQQHAKVLRFNTELHSFARQLLTSITPLVRNANIIDNLATATESLNKVNAASTIYSQSVNSINEGNEIITNLVETSLDYEAAILQCKRALAMRFLVQINGSRFVNLEKHVTIDDKHWYRVRRHASKNIDLWKEITETDINPPYQWISRMIDSMADSPDIINQMIYNSVEEEKHRANVKTLELREKLRVMHDQAKRIRWIDKKGKVHTGIDYELLFERYNDQVDEYGLPIIDKKTGKTKKGKGLTGNIISDRNWGEWEREKKNFLSRWEDDFYEASIKYVTNFSIDSNGNPEVDPTTGKIKGTFFNYTDDYTYEGVTYVFGNTEQQRQEYRKHFHEYVEKNAVVVSREFYSKSDMVNTAGYLEAFVRAKRQWNLENSVRIPLTDAKGEIILDSKGNPKKVWAPATAADVSSVTAKRNLYNSKQFDIITDNKNVDLRNWYYSYLSIKRSLDELIPTGGTNLFGLSAPQFNGTLTNRLHNALSGDNKGKALGMTLQKAIAYNISTLEPGEIEFGVPTNTYDDGEINKKDGALIAGRAHSNTLSFEERLPIYGVRKLRNISDLSTDLMHSTLAYASMAYNYSCLNQVVDTIQATAQVLSQRKVGNVEMTVEQLKKEEGVEVGTYARLEDYIKHQIFNDYSNHNQDYTVLQAGWRKLMNQAVKLSSWWFLKGNFHSALTNAITGMTEIFKESTADTNFNRRTLLKAMVWYMGWWVGSRLIRLGNSAGLAWLTKRVSRTKYEKQHGSTNEDYMKMTLFLRHFNVLNDNARDFLEEHQETHGYQIFNHFSYMQFTMLPYTITDEWMQAIPYIASAMHLKLRNKNNHAKVKSLWDLYAVKDGLLKCADGEFSDWEVENRNVKAAKQVIARRTRDMQVPSNATFEEIEFYKDPTNEWDTWDLKTENQFRLRCRGCNNRLHGIYNTGDGGALLGNILGPMILSLKKYAIGLIDRRFARARYDFRIRGMRQGSTTTVADLFVDLVLNLGSYQEDENGNVTFGPVSGFSSDGMLSSKFKNWETKAGARQAFGFIVFLGIFARAMIGWTPKKYLNKRGYSNEQINNINRTVHDTLAILCMRAILTICWPPEDDEKEAAKKEDARLDELWWPGQALLSIYSKQLQFFAKARRMTLKDEEMITPQGIADIIKKHSGVLPFTAKGMAFFQTYRALREQWAYNFFAVPNVINGIMAGPAPEARSLLDSFVPALAGTIDMLKFVTGIWGLYMGDIDEEEIQEMKDKGDKDYKKYDTTYIQTQNQSPTSNVIKDPYNAEIYVKGENKDWYKGSMKFVKVFSGTRTLRTWCDGYSSAYNNEYANKSELLEYAKLQGWDWVNDLYKYVGNYTVDLINSEDANKRRNKQYTNMLDELEAR